MKARHRRPGFVGGVEECGDAQQAAHRDDRIGSLLRHHEFEDPDGIELASLANQAAAFASISRSWRNCRTSRLR